MDLTTISRAFLDGVLSQIWQSTLLLVAVAAIASLLRNAPARVRHALWLVVLARLIIPPIHLGIDAVPADLSRAIAAPLSYLSLPATLGVGPGGRLVGDDDAAALPATGGAAAATSAQIPAHALADAGLGAASIVLLAWLAIALVLLGGFAFQMARVRRLVRRARPAPEDAIALLERLSARLRVRRRVRVMVSDELDAPIALGVFKPAIVLPRYLLDSLNEGEMQSVLAHELAHVRRWDVAIHWIAALARIAYFFHPAAWIVAARIRRERELAADELALRAGGRDALSYGRTLLKIAEAAPRMAMAPGAAIALSAAARDLERRIRAIKRPRSVRGRWAAVLAAALFALTLIAPAADSSAPERRAEPSDREHMLAFADALSRGDRAALNRYLTFEEPLDRRIFEYLASEIAAAPEEPGKPRVDLVHAARIADDRLAATFLVRAPAALSSSAVPLSFTFKRQQEGWASSWSMLRGALVARERGPAPMARRALASAIIGVRFGGESIETWFARARAQREAYRILGGPPYNIEGFHNLAEPPPDAEQKQLKAIKEARWFRRKKLELCQWAPI